MAMAIQQTSYTYLHLYYHNEQIPLLPHRYNNLVASKATWLAHMFQNLAVDWLFGVY